MAKCSHGRKGVLRKNNGKIRGWFNSLPGQAPIALAGIKIASLAICAT
jgi:hypothetical protein